MIIQKYEVIIVHEYNNPLFLNKKIYIANPKRKFLFKCPR